MAGDVDIVSVYKAANTAEAHIVRLILADEGIDARVTDENEPFPGLPLDSPHVIVAATDEAKARQIIEEHDRRPKS